MHVPPSSGDCARGLDQSMPATVNGRSPVRWQHPEVIENTNEHRAMKSSPKVRMEAGRTGRTRQKQGKRCAELTPPYERLPFPHLGSSCIGATRQGFPTARLLAPVAALGPDRSWLRCVEPIARMREWQACSFGYWKTPAHFPLDTDRPSHGSPRRKPWGSEWSPDASSTPSAFPRPAPWANLSTSLRGSSYTLALPAAAGLMF
jgi:hypothetical protein